jgi:acyl-CoA thioesterase
MNAERFADPADARPYYRLLGLRTDAGMDPGHARIRLEGRPELANARGDIHGGVVASLLDAAMGVAVRSAYREGEGATTVSLTVNYLAPGRGTLVATARVMRAGQSLASVEAEVVDQAAHRVAHGVATMRILSARKPAPGPASSPPPMGSAE